MKNSTPTSDKDLTLIARHFDYDLSEAETDRFYERMDKDAAFETKVASFKKAHQASLGLFHTSTKKETAVSKLLKAEVATPPTTKVIPLWKKLAVAASFALALLIGYQLNNPSFDSSETIAMSHTYLHQINLDDMARSSTSINQEKKDLLTAFNNNAYKACIELTQKPNLTSDEKLVRGISFLELKELEKAKAIFLAEVPKMDGQRDVALWGLVHIHLKQGDISQAKERLTALMNPDYANPRIIEKAEKLLEKLPK